MKQPDFFDVEERLARLSGLGDQLEAFSRTVDFEVFRRDLNKAVAYSDGSKGGRPPFDPVLMFKILIIGHRGGHKKDPQGLFDACSTDIHARTQSAAGKEVRSSLALTARDISIHAGLESFHGSRLTWEVTGRSDVKHSDIVSAVRSIYM